MATAFEGTRFMSFNPSVCSICSLAGYGTLLWLALVGTALVQSELVGPPKPAEEDAPFRTVLTGEDAKRVAELEKTIDELEAAGKLAEAQGPAREVAEIRRRVQGAKHWEAADAGRRLRTLTQIAALSAKDQAELVTARKLDAEAAVLIKRGLYAQAEAPLQRALAIRCAVLSEDHPDTAGSYNDAGYILNAQ